MTKKSLLLIAFSFASIAAWACTNFLAGRGATVDGSTMITYSADSYNFFGALYHSPAATYPPGTMKNIYDWHTKDLRGQIKQVERTYSVIGNINEHQVTIAESTFGGRPELVNPEGIMDYGGLKYTALQRARTAREAIKIIIDLVAEYGYGSSGESFSIGDPNEVWIMELIGKGPGRKGAVWVAKRVPDDYITAHANQARITTFPLNDRENVLYSPDVISFAREMSYFSGRDRDFSFSDTYAPLDFRALFWCEARVWTFFRQLDPEMDKYFSYVIGETKERMPLWIKPVNKVSVQDFKRLMRDQYEGTPLDVTQNMAAGPFHSKLRLAPLSFTVDGVEYAQPRPISTQQTGFSFVSQMRGWLPNHIGGILWFGVDDAVSSLYIPFYAGILDIPFSFSFDNGTMLKYSSTSAFWLFNKVANFAYARWSMMFPDIQKVQQHWENNFYTLIPAIDQAARALPEDEARDLLTHFSISQADAAMTAWNRLFEYLLVKNLDGVQKGQDENGRFLQNEHGITTSIIRHGYPEEFLRKMVENNQNSRVKTEEELENRR
jgi:dipeptidase